MAVRLNAIVKSDFYHRRSPCEATYETARARVLEALSNAASFAKEMDSGMEVTNGFLCFPDLDNLCFSLHPADEEVVERGIGFHIKWGRGKA